MSSRNSDRRVSGREAIERRHGGQGVPDMPEPLVPPPPPPPPPPPARPTGHVESAINIGFGTSRLQDNQEQLLQRDPNPQQRALAQQQAAQGPQQDPLVRTLERLF